MKKILAACFVALVISSAAAPEALEAKPVTFAYQTPTLSSTMPITIGMEFGFFAAEGLELKPIFIIGGPTAIAALIGGDVDYTLAAEIGRASCRERVYVLV